LSLLSYSCDRPSLPSFPTRRSSDLLVLLFAAYALVDGIFNIVAAVRAPREGRRWGWLLFSGVIGIATGLISFFWPGLTALALVRSEEHTSELQPLTNLVCPPLLLTN